MSELYKNTYNPDVLSCLANLSNDEVFTPPEIANDILDMLPKDIWKNSKAKFLDPACKSGVFLREIAKRLIEGLKDEFPNLQERIDHIFHNQLYGISITELTSLLSRRSVYCSKFANSKYSISQFQSLSGNIQFNQIKHTWKKGQCIYCGASKDEYDRNESLESHAYEFIHTDKIKDISDMKFDVIISNPPYQLSDGGAQASAIPIYNKFIEKAIKLKPRFLTMIIPARWMTGGRGLEKFRNSMIHDKHISILHDYENSKECFNGVEIKGGICYFLWERDKEGKCNIYRHNGNEIAHSNRYLVEPNENIYIRYEKLISIKNKVWSIEKKSFENIVSSQKPYGLRGDFFKSPSKYNLPEINDTPVENGYRIMGLSGQKRCYKYVPKDYPFPKKGLLNNYKIFVPRNWGVGELGEVPAKSIFAKPGEACTETFIEIGPFKDETEMHNAYSYFCTKFFRTLVYVRKQDQSSARAVYSYVPLQDFSKPWTDIELYKKYNLIDEEIDYIESNIKPMDFNNVEEN